MQKNSRTISPIKEQTSQPPSKHTTPSQRRYNVAARLYNFDPLKPHFYIVKLGFTGIYIIFLISAQNINCGTL